MQLTPINSGVFESFYNKRKELQTNAYKTRTEKARENKGKIAALALIGATVPVIAANIKRGGITNIKNSKNLKEGLLAFTKLFETEGIKNVFASVTGAVVLGTIGGLNKQQTKRERKEKYKEGTFQFLNTMIPTLIALGGHKALKAAGKENSNPLRAALIAGSVASGMFAANKISNKLNKDVFDKDEEFQKRNFQLKDCLVHIDDIINVLVISKVPFVAKIHADRILPFLYAKVGYEAGHAQKDDL